MYMTSWRRREHPVMDQLQASWLRGLRRLGGLRISPWTIELHTRRRDGLHSNTVRSSYLPLVLSLSTLPSLSASWRNRACSNIPHQLECNRLGNAHDDTPKTASSSSCPHDTNDGTSVPSDARTRPSPPSSRKRRNVIRQQQVMYIITEKVRAPSHGPASSLLVAWFAPTRRIEDLTVDHRIAHTETGWAALKHCARLVLRSPRPSLRYHS